MVVCFDPVSSPIRAVQRLGRTGRQRSGLCLLLLTEREERTYHDTLRRAHELQQALDEGRGLDLKRPQPPHLPSKLHCQYVSVPRPKPRRQPDARQPDAHQPDRQPDAAETKPVSKTASEHEGKGGVVMPNAASVRATPPPMNHSPPRTPTTRRRADEP